MSGVPVKFSRVAVKFTSLVPLVTSDGEALSVHSGALEVTLTDAVQSAFCAPLVTVPVTSWLPVVG